MDTVFSSLLIIKYSISLPVHIDFLNQKSNKMLLFGVLYIGLHTVS